VRVSGYDYFEEVRQATFQKEKKSSDGRLSVGMSNDLSLLGSLWLLPQREEARIPSCENG
jgi:hypothetical protein